MTRFACEGAITRAEFGLFPCSREERDCIRKICQCQRGLCWCLFRGERLLSRRLRPHAGEIIGKSLRDFATEFPWQTCLADFIPDVAATPEMLSSLAWSTSTEHISKLAIPNRIPSVIRHHLHCCESIMQSYLNLLLHALLQRSFRLLLLVNCTCNDRVFLMQQLRTD